jgi:hypothetical protein
MRLSPRFFFWAKRLEGLDARTLLGISLSCNRFEELRRLLLRAVCSSIAVLRVMGIELEDRAVAS